MSYVKHECLDLTVALAGPCRQCLQEEREDLIKKAQPTGVVHPVIMVFDEMQEIVESKAHDYASDTNVFSNFEFAANVAGVTVVQEFMVMIGTKVARLRELGGGKAPNNESMEDSLLDLANYAALCVAWMREQG